MKIGPQIKFIAINKQASSLYTLIADGKYRATSLGRNTWKTLVGSQASLQHNCNKEGFNVVGTAEAGLERESASSETMKFHAVTATQESGLVLEGSMTIPTPVETKQREVITVTST